MGGAGEAAGTAASLQAAGQGGGISLGSVAYPLAAITAAELARQKWGQLDRPYDDRGPLGKWTSAPAVGAIPAALQLGGLGESNYLAKPFNRLARMEEKLVGEPLDAFFQGDIGGGLDSLYKGALDAPRDLWNSTVGSLTGLDTWLCTATDTHVGTTADQKKAMRKLRRFTRRNHKAWLNAYLVEGPALVEAIGVAEKDLTAFYSALRDSLVVPVVDLVTAGQMEAAFDLYKQITVGLCKKYAPTVNTEVKEV
jgi:hypothetical protein